MSALVRPKGKGHTYFQVGPLSPAPLSPPVTLSGAGGCLPSCACLSGEGRARPWSGEPLLPQPLLLPILADSLNSSHPCSSVLV